MKNFNFFIKSIVCLFLLISCDDSEINQQNVIVEDVVNKIPVNEKSKNNKKPPVLPDELHYRLWSSPNVVPVYLHVYRNYRTPTDFSPNIDDVAIASQILIDDYSLQGIEICITEIKTYDVRMSDNWYDSLPNHVEGYLNLSLGDRGLFGSGYAGDPNGPLGLSYDLAKIKGSTNGTYRLHDRTIVHETGHCFGLIHAGIDDDDTNDDGSNIMTNQFPLTTGLFTQFTDIQRDYMQNIIRTTETLNKWHEYLDIEENIILGDYEDAIFDFQPSSQDYSDIIEITEWKVSPNLTINNQVLGNPATLDFSTSGECYGTAWIEATLKIGDCDGISICKQISIVNHPDDKPAVNFVNYICGSSLIECDFEDYNTDCKCPVYY